MLLVGVDLLEDSDTILAGGFAVEEQIAVAGKTDLYASVSVVADSGLPAKLAPGLNEVGDGLI